MNTRISTFVGSCSFIAGLTLTSPVFADTMIGSYIPGDGFSVENIEAFNNAVEKPLAFVNLFSSFTHDWDHLYWQTTNIVGQGAVPMISWMPIDLERRETNILPEILLGQWDPYIDLWIEKLNAWVASYSGGEKPSLMIRFGHEFNGTWYSYGDSPEFFKSVWVYIHDRFEQAGANQHVEWVWVAGALDLDNYHDITAYYPGGTFVDWTGLDGYNWGSNYSYSSWESFSEIYANQYLNLVDNYPEKPIMIAEVASAEPSDIPLLEWGQYGDDSDAGESKELWLTEMLSAIETEFPAIRAFAVFNINKELNWGLTGSANTGLDSFNAGLASPHFTSGFLSAKFTSPVAETTEADLELEAEEEERLALRQLLSQELASYSVALDVASENQEQAQEEFDEINMSFDTLTESLSIQAINYVTLREQLETVVSSVAAKRKKFNDEYEDFYSLYQMYLSLRAVYIDQFALVLDEAAQIDIDRELNTDENIVLAGTSATNVNLKDELIDVEQRYEIMRLDLLGAYDNLVLSEESLIKLYADLQALSMQVKVAEMGLIEIQHEVSDLASERNSSVEILEEKNELFMFADVRYFESYAALAEFDSDLPRSTLVSKASVEKELFTKDKKDNGKDKVLDVDEKTDEIDVEDTISSAEVDDSTGMSKDEEKVEKKIAKVLKKIDAKEQKALAKLNRPTGLSKEKVEEKIQKFLNMNGQESDEFISRKHSVLDY